MINSILKRKILCISTSLTLVCSLVFTNFNTVKVEATSVGVNNLPEDIDDGLILHAWNWSFDTIKENLSEIAEAGYTAIQTSPVQGTKESSMETSKWWLLYQPTNFKIGNAQLGTREEFKNMCEEAEKYGIKIIVDVVANHTANSGSSAYYPDSSVDSSIRDNESFWHEHTGVSDWNDRWQVTHLGIGLPDLNSANWDLQDQIIYFLNDCIECGADGFRFDAAKHIELPSDPGGSDFWTRVLNSLDRDDLFIYGEVLQGGADNYAAYTDYMDVTASNYGYSVRNAVGYGSSVNVNNILSYSVPSGVEADNLVTWVESHDNYANDDKVSTYMSDYQIKMAWAMIAARADSSALFFARPEGTTQNSGYMGVVGSTLWEDSDIAEVNEFHNDMVGESEYIRTQGDDIAMIERGTKGMVIVNLGSQETINTATNLSDGIYVDKISGNTFTVSNGVLTGTSNGYSISVIYNEESNPTVSVDINSCKFVDSIDVTLNAANVDYATYSINGGQAVNYTNGTTITIGKDASVGDKISLTLTGYKDDKVTTKNLTYEKVDKLENAVVYFQKPSSWSTPYVYIYDDSNTEVKVVSQWPGVSMTSLGDNLYTYTLPEGWDTAKVIFNDGTNQVPGVGESGYTINIDEKKIYVDGSWEDYSEENEELSIKSFNTSKDSPQYVGKSIDLSAEAIGGEGALNYKFTVSNSIDETVVLSDYSANSSITWTPTESGKYLLMVTVKDETGESVTSQISFTIKDVEEGTTVYFDKPDNWSTANIYVYNEDGSSVNEVAAWPGVVMTDEGNGRYSYVIPENWDSAYVIFNDGNNQVPASGQTGYKISAGESKIYTNGSWSNYNVAEETKVYFNNTYNWSTVKIYVYDDTVSPTKEISSWPGIEMTNEGNGLYSYTIPDSWSRANVIFTDGSNQYPATGETGYEVNSGESKIFTNGSWNNYNK